MGVVDLSVCDVLHYFDFHKTFDKVILNIFVNEKGK